jgi:putative DNA primase/helicase
MNEQPKDLRTIIEGAPAFEESPDDTIARLVGLTIIEYDQVRSAEAKRLGVRVTTLDRDVAQRRKQTQRDAAKEQAKDGLALLNTEVWDKPVEGRALLDAIHKTLSRFVIAPKNATIAIALWIVFTYLIEDQGITTSPRLVITSPVMRCGKTRLLGIISRLALRSLSASNITPAMVFRTCDICPLTLLIDEADTFVKGKEELRGLINSGHTREAAYVLRATSPDDFTPRKFSTWGAFGVAAIGRLPATWVDRSIVIKLKRKLKSEKVRRYRAKDEKLAKLLTTLAQKINRWVRDNRTAIVDATVDSLEALDDRAADNWEHLLAIAAVAGGGWPEMARAAAIELSGGIDDNSIRTLLLGDLRTIFKRLRAGLADPDFQKLMGIVEVDETYIGGKDRNRHWNKKSRQHREAGTGTGYSRELVPSISGSPMSITSQNIRSK